MRTRSVALILNSPRSFSRSYRRLTTTPPPGTRATVKRTTNMVLVTPTTASIMSQPGNTIISLSQKNRKGEQILGDDSFYVWNDYFHAEKPITPNQAAQAITGFAPEPTIDSDGNKTLSDEYLFRFWREIFQVVEQIPIDHPAMDKVVMFMRELTLLSETDITVWGSHVWTHLPIFGAATREQLNRPSRSKDPEEQADMDRRWVRFHAFQSKLMGAGLNVTVHLAIWMFRTAFEEDPGPDQPTQQVERELLTAAVYIEWFGPMMAQMLHLVPEPELSNEEHRLMKGGKLYGTDKSGLSAERWRFWIGKFREQAGKASDGSEAKRYGERAARLMEVWMEDGKF